MPSRLPSSSSSSSSNASSAVSYRARVMLRMERLARKLTLQQNTLQLQLQRIQSAMQVQQAQIYEYQSDLNESHLREQQMHEFVAEIESEITLHSSKLATNQRQPHQGVHDFDAEMQEIRHEIQQEQELQQSVSQLLCKFDCNQRELEMQSTKCQQALQQLASRQQLVLMAALRTGIVKLSCTKQL